MLQLPKVRYYGTAKLACAYVDACCVHVGISVSRTLSYIGGARMDMGVGLYAILFLRFLYWLTCFSKTNT